MKVYRVVHYFDIDGGFGNAVETEETVAAFTHMADAMDFISEHSRPHVYDEPDQALECGRLDVQALDLFADKAESDQAVANGDLNLWWEETEDDPE